MSHPKLLIKVLNNILFLYHTLNLKLICQVLNFDNYLQVNFYHLSFIFLKFNSFKELFKNFIFLIITLNFFIVNHLTFIMIKKFHFKIVKFILLILNLILNKINYLFIIK